MKTTPEQLKRLANEQHAEITRLREENARLRETVKDAYYEGWQDSASREYSRQEIQKDWETSEAFAAIRQGVKDD